MILYPSRIEMCTVRSGVKMKKDDKFEKMMEAYMELQKPIYHIPTNLGINAFKREAKAAGLPRGFTNKLIKAYKKRSWMEYRGIARYRGTFPAHPKYGKGIKVKIVESETTINVK